MGIDRGRKSRQVSKNGWRLVQQGKCDEALKAFEEAISLDPTYPQAWQGYGSTFGLLGRHLEALEAFQKAIELDPAYAQAWNNKGIVLGSLERHQEALEAFERAISLNATYPQAWRAKGHALIRLGRYDEALEIIEGAIELDPNCANVWHDKGIILGRLKRHAEALDAFGAATTQDPENGAPWKNKSTSLGNLNQAMEIVGAFIGWSWLDDPRKRKPAPEHRHMLIQYWDGAAETLRQGSAAIANSEEAAWLMVLASCLVICPRMSCFRAEHTRQELMDIRQFGHEFYMLRVADWYKRLGHNVEIHPPPGHDITISVGGFPTHLECKTKRPLAERDIKVEAVWEHMYELVNKEMDRAGINAIVYVDSVTDPVDEDLGRLIGIFRALLNEGRNITALLHDDKYKITIRLTPRPGEAIKTAGLKWKPWGQFERGTSAVKVTKEGAQLWDVRHFFFKSREDRDYVKTVLYSLAQAGKQLPKEGPGIVYIEVAPPSGQTPISRRLSEIRQRLVRELRDGHNRRVNAVILSCTHFEPPEGLTANFASVFHTNPRAPLPTGFHVAGTREDSENSKILPLNF